MTSLPYFSCYYEFNGGYGNPWWHGIDVKSFLITFQFSRRLATGTDLPRHYPSAVEVTLT